MEGFLFRLRWLWSSSPLGDALLSLGTSASVQILNLTTSVATARLLGSDGRGALAAILLWPLILAIVGGLDTTHGTMVYLIASADYPRKAVAATGIWLASVMGIALFGIGYVLSPVIFHGYSSSVVFWGRVLFLSTPLSLLGSVAMSVVLGQLRVRLFNAMRLSTPLFTVLAIGGLVVTGTATLPRIALAYLIAAAFPVGFGLVLALRHRPIALRTSRRLIRDALAYAARSHLGSLSSLANERADQAMISLFLRPAQLGLYAVAGSAASPLFTLGSSLGFVVLPSIASLKSDAARAQMLVRFTKAVLYVSLLALLAGLLLLPIVVPFVFGAGYTGSIRSSQILLAATAVLGLNRVLNSALKALNRPLATARAEAGAVVVTITTLVILLPLFGIIGAATASLLAYTVSCILMLMSLRRLGISPMLLFWPNPQDFRWIRARVARWYSN